MTIEIMQWELFAAGGIFIFVSVIVFLVGVEVGKLKQKGKDETKVQKEFLKEFRKTQAQSRYMNEMGEVIDLKVIKGQKGEK